MAMAMYSAISKREASGDVAMTGEITLRGNVLPIGGLNEKLLAAKRNLISTVIIPKDNEKDLVDIKDTVKQGLKIIPVENIKEAIPVLFKKKRNRSKTSSGTK
jgi:ATP-dependent Lon protease